MKTPKVRTEDRVRELHSSGMSRDDIAEHLQVSPATVRLALKFVEDIRGCVYDPEPHDVGDHRNCRGRDVYMDFDDPEEFPK